MEAIPSQLFLGAVVLNRAAPEVLALRIEIYRKLKKWELMREIAKRLNDFQPNGCRSPTFNPLLTLCYILHSIGEKRFLIFKAEFIKRDLARVVVNFNDNEIWPQLLWSTKVEHRCPSLFYCFS